MLAEDDPAFANWDQDVTAIDDHYDLQDPAVVSGELAEAARAMADLLRAVADSQWSRTGRRSNGSLFTVDTIGRYYLHDIVHHLHDVGFDARAVTAGAYDRDADARHEGDPRPDRALAATLLTEQDVMAPVFAPARSAR